MNISLTILCAIGVLVSMVCAFLGRDDVETGVIFPWQFIVSGATGFLITHGEHFLTAYAWLHVWLMDDGAAGVVVSAVFAGIVEIAVACLPMLAGAGVHVLLSALDERFPLVPSTRQSRCGRIAAYLRSFAIR